MNSRALTVRVPCNQAARHPCVTACAGRADRCRTAGASITTRSPFDEWQQHAIARRTTELQASVERLTNFNRSVSHDLRGPLQIVNAAMEFAMNAIASGDTPQALQMLSLVQQRTRGLSRLLDDLLSLAQADGAVLETQSVDLTLIAQAAIDHVRSVHSSEADALPAVDLLPLPQAWGVSSLLQQVFVNLLGNAAKFTRGVTAPRIEIGLTTAAQQDALYVRDNGVGFDATKATTLFEPFRRLHPGYHGHGLGLSIVRQIVERHGGRIWAESAPGAGCTFFFTLARLGHHPVRT